MPVLYDRQGNPVEVPTEQVPQALASGQYGLPRGQKVIMRDEVGDAYEFDPQDVAEAAQSGMMVESPEQAHDRELQEEYGDFGGEALAGAAGALRGLTFGGSDIVMSEMFGLGDELSGLREANPTASMGGEMAAIAGSLFVPGGQGRAIQGIRGLTAAPRGVARLGLGVERTVGRALGTAEKTGLAKVLARGAEVGAGAAVEGGIYGAGQFLTDVALGDTEATAENLLQHVGMGAAIGGGFGAGLGGGFQGIGELASGTAKLTKKGAESVVKMWERSSGNKALPGVADAFQETFNKAAGVVTGRVDDVAALSGREARAKSVQNLDDARDAYAREWTSKQNDVIEGESAVWEFWGGEGKKANFKEKIGTENTKVIRDYADNYLGSGIPAEVTDQFGRRVPNPSPGAGGLLAEVDDAVRSAKGTQARTLWNDVGKLTDEMQAEIRAAAGKADEAARIQSAMNSYKQGVQRLQAKAMRIRERDGTISKFMDRAGRIEKGVRETLEDENLWGKAAASAQREVNASATNRLAHVKRRPDHRLEESYETTGFVWERRAKPQGHRALIDDMGTTKYDQDGVWLKTNRDTARKLFDDVEKHMDLDVATKAKIDKARKALDDIDRIEKEALATVGPQNQLKALEEAARGSGFDATSGVIGGAILGGPVGAVAGGVLGAVMNPAKTIRQLATLERIASGQRERISAAVKNLVSKAKRAGRAAGKTRRLIAPASVGAVDRYKFSQNPKPTKDRVGAYKERVSELQEFVGNQPASIAKLTKGSEVPSAVAPTVTQAVNSTAVKAAQFLLDKAPKDPGQPGIFKRDWKPSLTAIARWERFAEAVCNPESVIKDLENGTLTHEAVEALREIYPKTYQQIVENLMESADEIAETMPYQQRVQLSVLFDAPIDQTMRPEFVTAMQESQIGAPNLQPQSQPAARVGGLEPMTQAQRLAVDRRG